MKNTLKTISTQKLIIIFFIALISPFIIIPAIELIQWKKDSDHTDQQISNIEEDVFSREIPDGDNTELLGSPEDQNDLYWRYIKMNLLEVDFSELKETNQETVGWIQVAGTNINYPFVQAVDNQYYLTHSFDHSPNQAGWVFLDYRNNLDNLGRNTIIYAHGRYDSTMFGSLKNILGSTWHKNLDNHIIKMSTEKENTLWQVFSVYRIKTTNDYIQVNFTSDANFQLLIDKIKARSAYSFDANPNATDKILTLSTCYNKSEKVVMHAKLIKRSARS